ncbi:MAG: carboxypeptidase-like regulatory domain-containing protein, partial [Candidatus Dadabacteria bacterium]
MRKGITLFFIFLSPLFLIAQQRVSGRVTDENTQPLRGASVTVRSTTTGVTTDADGRFEITVPNLQSTLVISFVGFAKQE